MSSARNSAQPMASVEDADQLDDDAATSLADQMRHATDHARHTVEAEASGRMSAIGSFLNPSSRARQNNLFDARRQTPLIFGHGTQGRHQSLIDEIERPQNFMHRFAVNHEQVVQTLRR